MANESSVGPSSVTTVPTKCPAWVPLSLGLYLLVAGLAAVGLLVDAWTKQFAVLRFFFHSVDPTAIDVRLLQTMTYMIAGTILGAVVISFRGLHEHAVLRADFRPSFAGSYLLGPWASAFLGIAMYGLIRGGLFLLGGTGNVGDQAEATDFSYLGLGFLIGFAWNRVLRKLDSLAAEMFRTSVETRPVSGPAAGPPNGPNGSTDQTELPLTVVGGSPKP